MAVKRLHMITPDDPSDYRNHPYDLSRTAGTERPVTFFKTIRKPLTLTSWLTTAVLFFLLKCEFFGAVIGTFF